MTPSEADQLLLSLTQMSTTQLFKLWRLIYLIIRHKLDHGEESLVAVAAAEVAYWHQQEDGTDENPV